MQAVYASILGSIIVVAYEFYDSFLIPVIVYVSANVFSTFQDFQDMKLERVVEMDTVISAGTSRKVLLTFYFWKEKLFLAFLLYRKTSSEVHSVFNRLETRLDTYPFLSLFETILTDQGTEFGNPLSLETGIHKIQRTSIYYCDPRQSCQKGGVENVHTMLRNVLPKGSSFELLTQWDVTLIVNHIARLRVPASMVRRLIR